MNASSLTDVELLSLLIGKRQTAELYQGALGPLFLAQASQPLALWKLQAARELVKRFLYEELRREHVFRTPQTVKEYLLALFAQREHETFVIMHLDSQHRLIAAEELFRGTIDGASVYPREVVKSALAHNSAAVVFAHNHPSGIAEPSGADRTLTERLRAALAIVDIRSLDHIVVGGATTISFAERGWI